MRSEEIRLVPTTEADRTYLARLNFLTETFGDEFGDLDDDYDRWYDFYINRWEPENGGVIAWVGNVPAGGLWLVWADAENHGFGYFQDDIPELAIAVERRYAGLGLGAKLISAAEDVVRGSGASALSLAVSSENPRARALYERLGFEATQTVREGMQVMVKYLS